jgi:2-polyprenyl-3-methyl-5-hydroxy-6-metoxy-1,4-benzoquinol methylase
MNYYDQNAQDFFDGTINVDMTSLYNEFIPFIPEKGCILDAGCGSGRDSKVFLDLGYKVHAIDASEELGKLAEQQIKQAIEITTFQQFNSPQSFDAIWACASLLHAPMQELPLAFNNLANHLKPKGVFYCSITACFCALVNVGFRLTFLGRSPVSS